MNTLVRAGSKLLARTALVAPFLLASLSCAPKITDVMQPSQLRDVYKKAGWTPLDYPDSKFEPGSVVVAGGNEGIRWIGHARSCGIPEDILRPTPGNIGNLNFTGNARYGAKAVLKIKGIEAGPEFNGVKSADLTQEDQSADAIDLLKLGIWLTNPDNQRKIPEFCTQMLSEPNAYLVQESFRVGKGKYTLIGSNDAKIAIKGIQAGPLTIDPSANAEIDGNGNLTLSKPVYTAIRRVKRVSPDKFIVLGRPGTQEKYDDEALQADSDRLRTK